MTYKAKEFSTLLELMAAIPNEEAAVEHFTATRWKNGPFCPYCGHKEILHFADKRRHRCLNCNERFSIRVGTIFQDSRKHLDRYVAESVWRFNRRLADEGSRFNDMLKLTDGRLRYDRLTA